ncbi:MAG: stringent starvation protein B [Gammaproteobacteria bacterium]
MSGADGKTGQPSRTPYFLRAFHEWAGDAGLTPQIIVNTEKADVSALEGYAKDGRIVFNLGTEAVRDLRLGNEAVEFNARFGGVARSIYVPIAAVLGIYALESGEGVAFPEEDAPAGEAKAEPPPDDGNAPKRPQLKVVK